jgi:hypothetical protein
MMHEISHFDFGSEIEGLPESVSAFLVLKADYNSRHDLDLFPENVAKSALVDGMPEPLKTQHSMMAEDYS